MRHLLCLALSWIPSALLAEEAPPPSTFVRSLAYSADGKYLAATSGEGDEPGTTTVWELATGKRVFLHQEPKGMPAAGFSPDGKHLAIGTRSENVLLVETATWSIKRKLPGHGEVARGLDFSKDGKLLAVAGSEGAILLWDTTNWAMRKRLDKIHDGIVFSVAFSPDDKTLASAGVDNQARLIDVSSGRIAQSFKHEKIIRRILLSRDNRHVVYTCLEDFAAVRERETGKWILRILRHGAADDIALSSDGSRLAFVSYDVKVVPIDLRPFDEGKRIELHRLQKGWEDDRVDVRNRTSKEIVGLGHSVMDDLEKIEAAAKSPEIRLRARLARAAILSPEAMHTITHPDGPVRCVAFSPDGRHLATGGAGGIVRIWDVETGRAVQRFVQYSLAGPRREY